MAKVVGRAATWPPSAGDHTDRRADRVAERPRHREPRRSFSGSHTRSPRRGAPRSLRRRRRSRRRDARARRNQPFSSSGRSGVVVRPPTASRLQNGRGCRDEAVEPPSAASAATTRDRRPTRKRRSREVGSTATHVELESEQSTADLSSETFCRRKARSALATGACSSVPSCAGDRRQAAREVGSYEVAVRPWPSNTQNRPRSGSPPKHASPANAS